MRLLAYPPGTLGIDRLGATRKERIRSVRAILREGLLGVFLVGVDGVVDVGLSRSARVPEDAQRWCVAMVREEPLVVVDEWPPVDHLDAAFVACFVGSLESLPVPLFEDTLVINCYGDCFGTVQGLIDWLDDESSPPPARSAVAVPSRAPVRLELAPAFLDDVHKDSP